MPNQAPNGNYPKLGVEGSGGDPDLEYEMKGQSFQKRCRYACHGLASAFRHEASFRAEVILGVAALLFTLWLRPSWLWAALVAIMVAAVLAAELFNTALEHLLDGLHPDEAEFARVAKDCAAAAVMIFSLASLAVFLMMVCDVLGNR